MMISFYFFIFFFVNRLYSFLPSSLLNARLHFHVIHPHLIIQHKVSFSSRFISFFSFLIKNKKNKILCNFTSDLLLCLRISDLKCGQKTPKRMGPWEKTFPFFWSHLLAIISRNVGTKGHLRKEIVLLKYQVFRFGTKSGGQFELLNWLEKSTRLLMLEDYDLFHFTIR